MLWSKSVFVQSRTEVAEVRWTEYSAYVPQPQSYESSLARNRSLPLRVAGIYRDGCSLLSLLISERVYVCDLWQSFHHPRLARCQPIPDPRCPCPSFHSQGLRFKQHLVFTSLLLWFMPPFHSYRPGKFFFSHFITFQLVFFRL